MAEHWLDRAGDTVTAAVPLSKEPQAQSHIRSSEEGQAGPAGPGLLPGSRLGRGQHRPHPGATVSAAWRGPHGDENWGPVQGVGA